MAIDWSPLVDLIRSKQRILLMTHVRPDADGLGSQLALAEALRSLGKTPRVVIASKLPPRYHFLDPERAVIEEFRSPIDRFRDVDMVIIMDTGTWNQIGEFGGFLRDLAVPKVVIDHHQTQDDLGAERFVDVSSESTGRLAHELITALGVPLTPTMANHLLMAVATDTGWFRHPNATSRTFGLAQELTAAGAMPTPIYTQLYETCSAARMKLIGRVLERLQIVQEGQVAFLEVYMNDYAATGSVPADTEDLIDYPRSIAGVEVGLLFVEQQDGGTKVSFRARSKVDVSQIAQQFNGGGHKLASGAKLKDSVTEARYKIGRAHV